MLKPIWKFLFWLNVGLAAGGVVLIAFGDEYSPGIILLNMVAAAAILIAGGEQ